MKTAEEILEAKLAGGQMLPYTRGMMIAAMKEYCQQYLDEYTQAYQLRESTLLDKLERGLEIAIAERDELEKHYETLIMEKEDLRIQLQFAEEHTTELADYVLQLEDTLGIRNQDEYIKEREEQAKNFGGI